MNYHALAYFLQVLQYSLSFRTILTKYTGILCMFGIPDFLSVDAGVSVQKWRHFPALENISFFWEKNQRRTLLCKIAAVVGHWSQVNSLLWKSFAAILLWKQIPLLIFFKFLLKTWEEVQNKVRGEKQLTMVCRRPGKHFNGKRGFVTGGAQRRNRHRV